MTISCKKKEVCYEYHYEDDSSKMVDLGLKCGNELETLEKKGVMVNDKKYDVHCHDH